MSDGLMVLRMSYVTFDEERFSIDVPGQSEVSPDEHNYDD
jgi:hypothetical protein